MVGASLPYFSIVVVMGNLVSYEQHDLLRITPVVTIVLMIPVAYFITLPGEFFPVSLSLKLGDDGHF